LPASGRRQAPSEQVKPLSTKAPPEDIVSAGGIGSLCCFGQLRGVRASCPAVRRRLLYPVISQVAVLCPAPANGVKYA